jgi:hypothetical protein
LNENINLKVKNRLIEECSKQETASLKKMLNDALEKTKNDENGTTSQEKEGKFLFMKKIRKKVVCE